MRLKNDKFQNPSRDDFETGKWLLPNEKYFIFQPSGGLSNQRIIIEQALVVCRALNRTCVLPMAAKHTSMWYNYNKQPLTDLMSFRKNIRCW